MENQQTIGAFDPWTLSLTVTYQDHTAGLLLAEVAKLHDPPLAFEKIVEDLELDVFVRCCEKDLYILDVQVGLQVKCPGKFNPTPLRLDRQLLYLVTPPITPTPAVSKDTAVISQTLGT